jgi:branched-chain amino acid transport system ATP-binding protein
MFFSVKNLNHAFGDIVIFKNLNFTWPDEVKNIGILGPNGSGKTTLFKIISGEIKPNEGAIFFENENITHLEMYKKNRKGISKTFQIPRPFLGMTVFENVYFGTIEYEKNEDNRILYTTKILKQFNLFDKMHILSDCLNVLECRLLEMARAFATQPKLILLDECMVGFEEQERNYFLNILSNIQQEQNCRMMMIEHNIDVLKTFCDYMIVIHHGELVIQGRPMDCLESDIVKKIYFHRL